MIRIILQMIAMASLTTLLAGCSTPPAARAEQDQLNLRIEKNALAVLGEKTEHYGLEQLDDIEQVLRRINAPLQANVFVEVDGTLDQEDVAAVVEALGRYGYRTVSVTKTESETPQNQAGPDKHP